MQRLRQDIDASGQLHSIPVIVECLTVNKKLYKVHLSYKPCYILTSTNLFHFKTKQHVCIKVKLKKALPKPGI